MIRPLNLGIIFLSFLLAFHLAGALFFPQGLLPAAAWIFLAAAGYGFNDLCNRAADAVNRPERPLSGRLSYKTARAVIMILALVAFIFALSFPLRLFLFFLLLGLLLFLYALVPRKGLALGNVAVALATSSPFAAVMLFTKLTPSLGLAFLFSFFIIWMREIAKDFDDLDGDRKAGRATLPIIAGKTWGLRFLWVLTFILAGFTMWGSLIAEKRVVYALFIIGGVNTCNAVALAAMTKGAYRKASLLLKISILMGMGGLWLSV